MIILIYKYIDMFLSVLVMIVIVTAYSIQGRHMFKELSRTQNNTLA